ncbi:hypothetical protein V8B97DRAFT_1984206 [Scleroderma yunnanense]
MLAPCDDHQLALKTRRFDYFPAELWVAILLYTDTRTILRCTGVCHRIKAIIDASVELQYRVELTLDGMIDSPPSTVMSVGERFTRLRALRQAWATLDWSAKIVVPMPGPCHAYEFVGGVFCKTHHSYHHRFSSRHLTTMWLPSAVDPIGRSIVRDDVGLPTRDFAIDPSQDLVILFRGADDDAMPVLVVPGMLELHVRTLSTNEPHPEARDPKLFVPIPFTVTSAFMAIVDDVVGMLYCTDPDRPQLTVWNWKTGKLLVNHTKIPRGTWDFSFISSRSFFVTSYCGTGSIEIFAFEDDSATATAPSITEFNSNLAHVASLHLPPPRSHIRVTGVHAHTAPFVARPPANRPFIASNEDKVHVLSVQYVDPNPDALMRQMRFCVVLKNKLLQGYVKRYEERERKDGGDGMGAVIVPWDQWGRENTRYMLHHWTPFEWLRYVHGNKVVLPLEQRGKTCMCVLDFNVHDTVRQSQCWTSVGDGSDTPEEKETSPKCAEHANEASQNLGLVEKLSGGCSGDASPSRVTQEPRSSCTLGPLGTTNQQVPPDIKRSPPRLVTEPTVEDHPLFFPAPLETTLPYRMVERLGDTKYSGVMLDEERIVGLSFGAFSNGDMKDIHVFTM